MRSANLPTLGPDDLCRLCSRALLTWQKDIGICGWCVMESSKRADTRRLRASYFFGSKHGKTRPPT